MREKYEEVLMAQTWRTVRVFIGSAFRDMQAEEEQSWRVV